ncbi:MAG TPA: hypothetical protein VFE46_04855 [Pirellulales bacterium]|nr:hypothetical protein [Pirellulales bacterium]
MADGIHCQQCMGLLADLYGKKSLSIRLCLILSESWFHFAFVLPKRMNIILVLRWLQRRTIFAQTFSIAAPKGRDGCGSNRLSRLVDDSAVNFALVVGKSYTGRGNHNANEK